jgi:hypothetical protein
MSAGVDVVPVLTTNPNYRFGPDTWYYVGIYGWSDVSFSFKKRQPFLLHIQMMELQNN